MTTEKTKILIDLQDNELWRLKQITDTLLLIQHSIACAGDEPMRADYYANSLFMLANTMAETLACINNQIDAFKED